MLFWKQPQNTILMMQTEVDLVILGAGCAGLSLAMHLAEMEQICPKTLLLEQRVIYENDRTWCFWGDKQTPFAHLTQHQWTEVNVQSGEKSALIDCSLAPYHILSGGCFYSHTIESIKKNSLLELKAGVTVLTDPEYHDNKWHLHTSFGQVVTKAIVDTRPIAIDTMNATLLWQSFLGYEIECEDIVFNPRTAHLMDFCESNSDYVGFTYLLPLSETKALIEFTVFAKKPYFKDELINQLNNSVSHYIKDKFYKVVRTESGLIPMGLSQNPVSFNTSKSNSGYVRVGVNAGAARPATGYAFQRIQLWAAQCAQSIKRTGLPISHRQDSWLQRNMDYLFLNVIGNNPILGPDLLMDLFSKTEHKRLIRFLSDKPQLFDYISVIKALPSMPFIKELVRLFIRR